METFFIVALIAFASGMALAHKLWKLRIQEKAVTGFRLEVDGQLYNVTLDHRTGAQSHE